MSKQSVCSGPLASLFGRHARSICFRKRQLIFGVGARSDAAFWIEHGGVKLTQTSYHGREAVISILKMGDFFGCEVFDQSCPPRFVNAVALTDVRLARVDRALILSTIKSQPSVCLQVISLLTALISELQLGVANNLSCSSDERLARALLSMSEMKLDSGTAHALRVSQQELADMIGTTRQRVNAILQRFKKMGLIDYSQGLHMYDSLRSIARAIDL